MAQIDNNALFELVYEEDRAQEGDVDKFKEFMTENKTHSLTMFHMNIQGINKKYDQLKIILNNLDSSFDLIVLTETRTDDSKMIIEQYNLDTKDTNYKIHYTRQHTRITDGVVLYVRDSLEHSVEELTFTDCNALKIQLKKIIIITFVTAFTGPLMGK